MKTASEIRALMMDKDVSNAPRVKSRLENEIVKAAKRGHGFVEAFVPVEDCSLICANTIRSELLDLGYECKIEYVADQRDGDCIRFFIKWQGKGESNG